MESAKTILKLVLHGLLDSAKGASVAAQLFYPRNVPTQEQSSRTRPKKHNSEPKRSISEVLRTCIVFGGLFWTAIAVFNNFFLGPCIETIFLLCLTAEEWRSWSYCTKYFLSTLFSTMWTSPLFFISRILTYAWYQEIADLTCKIAGIKNENTTSFSYSLSDMIISICAQYIYMLLVQVLYLFPLPSFLQDVVPILLTAILYALYAFEYKWIQKGWGMNKRLSYVDSKWPYFVGFGLPLAIATSFTGSYIESVPIFSIIFPFYVLGSTITYNMHLRNFNQPLGIFKPSVFLTEFLIKHMWFLKYLK